MAPPAIRESPFAGPSRACAEACADPRVDALASIAAGGNAAGAVPLALTGIIGINWHAQCPERAVTSARQSVQGLVKILGG